MVGPRWASTSHSFPKGSSHHCGRGGGQFLRGRERRCLEKISFARHDYPIVYTDSQQLSGTACKRPARLSQSKPQYGGEGVSIPSPSQKLLATDISKEGGSPLAVGSSVLTVDGLASMHKGSTNGLSVLFLFLRESM